MSGQVWIYGEFCIRCEGVFKTHSWSTKNLVGEGIASSMPGTHTCYLPCESFEVSSQCISGGISAGCSGTCHRFWYSSSLSLASLGSSLVCLIFSSRELMCLLTQKPVPWQVRLIRGLQGFGVNKVLGVSCRCCGTSCRNYAPLFKEYSAFCGS